MKVSVTPSIPHQYDQNHQATTSQQHNFQKSFGRVIVIPLFYRLTQKMKFRFTKFSDQVSKLL